MIMSLFPTVQKGEVEHRITTQGKEVLNLNHNN